MSKKHKKPNPSPRPSNRAPSKLVNIIIPVYGRFDMLKECLEALPEACGKVSYDVVMVDNASPKEEADAFYSQVSRSHTVIRNKTNIGFPAGCNKGAKTRNGPLIFFLNSDVVLRKDAVANMVKALDNPQVGIVGAKLLFPENTPHGPAGMVQHVGLTTGIHGEIIHLFIGWHPDHPKVLAVNGVLGVTGAALMVRRNLFNQVGGFDEVYGLGTYEDIDLCVAVMSLKSLVMVEQSAVGTHYVGGSSSHYKIHMPLNRNSMLFQSKYAGHLPWTEWVHA